MARKANAEPSGGGGGGWAAMNAKMAESRNKKMAGGLTMGEIENYDGADRTIAGTSIFDPVLCELAYRWFSPPGGAVLDPFAGGSVRGVVASILGRSYTGVDLSEDQIKANEAQIDLCNVECEPTWLQGDSTELDAVLDKGQKFDFIFSCPPYADLEVYSEDPRDISTFEYADFRAAMASVVKQACERLNEDRFACFVIGDARDKKGLLYGLPAHTVQMFEDAGLRLYNDAILATAIASLPIRCRKQFTASRKLGRCHQYVYVFVKGDPVKATKAIGEVQFGEGEDIGGDDLGAPEALGGEL